MALIIIVRMIRIYLLFKQFLIQRRLKTHTQENTQKTAHAPHEKKRCPARIVQIFKIITHVVTKMNFWEKMYSSALSYPIIKLCHRISFVFILFRHDYTWCWEEIAEIGLFLRIWWTNSSFSACHYPPDASPSARFFAGGVFSIFVSLCAERFF